MIIQNLSNTDGFSGKMGTLIKKALTEKEMMIIILSLENAAKKGMGLRSSNSEFVAASRYAEVVGLQDVKKAYQEMAEDIELLFENSIQYKEGNADIKERIISGISSIKDEEVIHITLCDVLIKCVKKNESYSQVFNWRVEEQKRKMKSPYSKALYEVLLNWVFMGGSDYIDIYAVKKALGIDAIDYQSIGLFEQEVLNVAVSEINEHTDYHVAYQSRITGDYDIGVAFDIKEKAKLGMSL